MKTRFLAFSVLALFFASVILDAQVVEGSSGKTNLNMRKTSTVVQKDDHRGSGVVKLDMKKSSGQEKKEATPVIVPATIVTSSPEGAGSAGEIQWLSPAFNLINTSEGTYRIQANVKGREQIRVVNFFLNGNFYKNYIPTGQTNNQMAINENLDLKFGNNRIRIEAITATNKKLESEVNINYDLSNAKFYALIIAIQDYADPNINDLDEPIRDASRFYNVIKTKYTFTEENILFLKNPTKADIIGTLHQMRNVVKPEDNLLIYYAGHGFWDEEMMTGYWLPSDASRDNPVNWLPNTDLTNYLNALKTKHTLLIADACFSGGIFKTRSAFTSLTAIEKLYKLPSRKAITSGTLTEVPDKSVFLDFLIRRLDENMDTYLASEQLFSSLRIAVMNNSPNIPQYGTIQNVGDEGGDFIFIRK